MIKTLHKPSPFRISLIWHFNLINCTFKWCLLIPACCLPKWTLLNWIHNTQFHLTVKKILNYFMANISSSVRIKKYLEMQDKNYFMIFCCCLFTTHKKKTNNNNKKRCNYINKNINFNVSSDENQICSSEDIALHWSKSYVSRQDVIYCDYKAWMAWRCK